MSDEIKAAMELMRKFESNGDRSARGEAEATMSAALTLAHLYLAEHDETPITEEWLRSVGVRYCGDIAIDGQSTLNIPVGSNCGSPTAWTYIEIERDDYCSGHTITIPTASTRGHVRRLCASLGIPLTEPGATNGG